MVGRLAEMWFRRIRLNRHYKILFYCGHWFLFISIMFFYFKDPGEVKATLLWGLAALSFFIGIVYNIYLVIYHASLRTEREIYRREVESYINFSKDVYDTYESMLSNIGDDLPDIMKISMRKTMNQIHENVSAYEVDMMTDSKPRLQRYLERLNDA